MKPPEFLGPYRIGKTIGKGGMGSVFQATHERSGQEVAVKLIASQVSDEMRFRRRFDTEIETLKLLSHPNIVKLIGYGEEHGMLFYSMEYVRGETLQDLIQRTKKLPWITALDIATQVCGALKHAHDFGVIHRDLKPANLMIQDDGVVKLLDFGISKIFGRDQTVAGSIMGTADYMSPEQANESGTTSRTDLYALGCVIYAMLCGKPPFRGKNVTEVITALKQKDPIPLDLIDPELPEDVVQIVHELLEKRPEDRPPTALAVMNRLKAMRAGLNHMQTLAEKSAAKPISGPEGDTASGSPDPSSGIKTRPSSEATRNSDTSPLHQAADSFQTAPVKADPLTGTDCNERRDGNRGTEFVTAVTAPMESRSRDSAPKQGDSAGAAGRTHFQTVSDGDVREGFFSTPAPKTEHPVARIVSITLLSLALLAGGVLFIQSLRGPSAEQLLAEINQQQGDEQSPAALNEMDRFLKLYPDHPQAEEIRQRVMQYRVEAAVRRLRLKAKLRMSDPPLYEQAFLEAMDLRGSDPQAARDKLNQWIDVFQNASTDDEDETSRLAKLARFQADALADQKGELIDPRAIELVLRIKHAKQLPLDARRKLLEGIVKLYEGQPWAEQARQQALEILESETE